MGNHRWAIVAAGWLLLEAAALWVGAATTAARPGSSFIIDVWDSDRGLPHSTVNTIVQTRDGYLWLGTPSGLVRFDGQRCEVFDEIKTPGLSSGQIVRLFEDREGTLWIGTETGGILRLEQGRLTAPLGPGLARGFTRRLASACQDGSGAVWLYTMDGQLWRHWQGRFTPLMFGPGRPSDCRSVIAEQDGPVWVGAYWGQCAIAPEGDNVALDLHADPELTGTLDYLLASRQGGYWRCLAGGQVQKYRGRTLERSLGPYPWREGSGAVTAACEDDEGNLIVGTRTQGVYWLDAQGVARPIGAAEGLPRGAVLALCLDREGNLWVGTDGGGLSRVKRHVFELLDESRGLPRDAVQSVAADAQGGLWLGLNVGLRGSGGVSYWKDGTVRSFGDRQGLQSQYGWSVYVDRERTVWAGTLVGGLYRFQDGQFQSVGGPSWIYATHQDRRGVLWFGTGTGLLRHETNTWRLFKTSDGLSMDDVRALADDAQGNLWVGTAGGGLNRFAEGTFTPCRPPPEIQCDDISSLYCDGGEVLWIGTRGSGLVRWAGGRWTRFTTREGLASNSIGYLIEDREGYLWIGSTAGLMRVRTAELNAAAATARPRVACRSYGRPDGLPTQACTTSSQPGACLDPEGRLWLATSKGLVGVDPKALRPNPHAPGVVIEDARIDGQSQNANPLRVSLPEPLVLRPGMERLEIRYTGLNLSAADQTRFRCRIEDRETAPGQPEPAWNDVGVERVAAYFKLPPGRYTFKVQACNEDGLWNPMPASLAIWVQPPVWRTWWFLSLAGAVVLGSGAGVVHYFSTQRLQRQLERMHHQEALEKERQRIAQDIHDQLGASLTGVTLMSELVESDKDHPEEVEAHARQIAQMTRDTTRVLDEIVWAVNPSHDTLESLISYACKHAQEFLAMAGLQYRLEVPERLPKVNLPPEFRHNLFLAFKEAVTNVVRHSGARAAAVRWRLEPGQLILEIDDDGRGLAGMDEQRLLTRNGVRGMEKRMRAIGGAFSIAPGPEKGTRVRFTAPLRGLGAGG